MSLYALARVVYRCADRLLLRHVPERWNLRLRGALLGLARRLFPARITARSATEFANSTSGLRLKESALPQWARAEVAELARIEPALADLLQEDRPVEHYVIPWDLTYVGHRYALARRQLKGPYVCVLLVGGTDAGITASALDALPRPLAVIDVENGRALADPARAAGADYVALPAEDLDANDHCAVLARLVLQLAPGALYHAAHPLLDRCIERHGLALASVSRILPWPGHGGNAGNGVGDHSRSDVPAAGGTREGVPDPMPISPDASGDRR